jgi:hypothetical protein
MNTTLTYHSPDYLADTRVTIVGSVTEENEKIKLSFGASRCAKPIQFCKKDGRQRATDRASNDDESILELKLHKEHWKDKQIVGLFRQISSALSIIIIEDSRKVKNKS